MKSTSAYFQKGMAFDKSKSTLILQAMKFKELHMWGIYAAIMVLLFSVLILL